MHVGVLYTEHFNMQGEPLHQSSLNCMTTRSNFDSFVTLKQPTVHNKCRFLACSEMLVIINDIECQTLAFEILYHQNKNK